MCIMTHDLRFYRNDKKYKIQEIDMQEFINTHDFLNSTELAGLSITIQFHMIVFS